MRNRRAAIFRVLSHALLSIVFAGTATAAPIGMTGTLTIDFGLAAITLSGSGTVDSTGGSLSVPAGFFLQAGPVIVPVTAVTAVASLSAAGISNLSGTFASGGVTSQIPSEVCSSPGPSEACVSGGGIGGQLALAGTINIVIIPNVVVFPIGLGDSLIGVGGATNSPFSFDGAPWTTQQVFWSPANTATGSNSGGSLSLVAATFIIACGNTAPAVATITLTSLVPEPENLLLIALGVTGIVATMRGRA